MPASEYLLKLQIGPIQDFIAAARSTRDLWSGSYLLSWLIATGVRHMQANADHCILVFPDAEKQPLLTNPADWSSLESHKDLLTPNLTNLFLARVRTSEPDNLGHAVQQGITNEWHAIADAVWAWHSRLGIDPANRDVFLNQVSHHLSIAWQITPLPEDSPAAYPKAHQENGRLLDAVRQVRTFDAWSSGGWIVDPDKDALTGREESLCGGEEFLNRIRRDPELKRLFKHTDPVGAITWIKRTWHLAYLKPAHKLKCDSRQFKIRSIPAIAARKARLDDDEAAQESTTEEKYIAAIAFDGDRIGEWVSGESLGSETDVQDHQRRFSRCLSEFALGRVRDIVEAMSPAVAGGVPLGQLIYAGGDDVVALVPADAALATARTLREVFRECTQSIVNKDGATPDASAGIAIGHVHAPLQELIRMAQSAEKRAKNQVGRPAFSITLMKRSGEISEWGSGWETGGVELAVEMDQLLESHALTGRFPHRVCQLLEPYLTHRTGISHQEEAIDDRATMRELIEQEFKFAVDRQSASKQESVNWSRLRPRLLKYLDGLTESYEKRQQKFKEAGDKPESLSLNQQYLTSLIGLCTTVAFTHRNRSDSQETQNDIQHYEETPAPTV